MIDQVPCTCVKCCGVGNLPSVLYIHLFVLSLKSNSMLCVKCCFFKLMPNLKPYMLTKCQYHKHTCHTQSYDIQVQLREAGG
jgi:hypothetical protein